ncbi:MULTISPECIES: zinc ABC transporter substrate-binding protein [unclassified Bifidobacterium]|uniref:metal ABC transporter solute-binding protein, Zn/Mn family n=1 Tax=unclassified Bifidobacterium TaxID=2608897 RepID=UPI0023F6B0A8|nr:MULTISPECIES: zinc ABC transporter substrate-binding protein [unclassified Bifidobacterium]WEV66601.1 zinc ABC transporter substrate-binding protein [Bifidobacterium sp. ESL0764]WEV76459.1 zinc ABC transporter substrate-binding protein [Bifidobacterium sp. ESL0800]
MAFVGSLCLVFGLAACGGGNDSQPPSKTNDSSKQASGPIKVVASINQWGSLARQIGGSDVKVTSIVNTVSVDAHDFEPQTADMAKLQGAEIVVVNGAGYDNWASKSIVKGTTSVSAATAVGASTGDNPHLWFSKDARKAMATELEDAFAKARPAKAKQFQARLKTWKASETKLEETMKTFSRKYKDATYGATEPVAYYLMDDLGFTDKTPKGYTQAVGSEGEPAPSDLQKFQHLISGRDVNLLINNTQEASNTTNLLTGTAGRTEVPVVDVSEQMPQSETTLTGWITALTKSIDKAMADFKASVAGHEKVNTGNSGSNSNDSGQSGNGTDSSQQTPAAPGTSNGSVPSNAGQTDPGK